MGEEMSLFTKKALQFLARLICRGGKIRTCDLLADLGVRVCVGEEMSLFTKKALQLLARLIYVGVARFELATSWSQTRRDDRTTLHPDMGVCVWVWFQFETCVKQ